MRRLVARLCVLALIVPGVVLAAPAAEAVTTSSFARLQAIGFEYIVHGGTYRSGTDIVGVSGSPSSVVQVDLDRAPGGTSEHYTFRFAAPSGNAIAVGTYAGAKNFSGRTAAEPAFEITRSGTATCSSTGSFEVLDLAADLSHFWIVWERRCSDVGEGAFGEIRYNMPTDPDLFVGAAQMLWPQLSYKAQPRRGGFQVALTGDSPVTFQGFAITGPGRGAFSVETDYCTTLQPPQTCSVSVYYRPVLVGRRDATLTISTSVGTQTVTLVDPGLAVNDPALLAAAGAPPDPASDLVAAADFNAVDLQWTDPGTIDWAETIVRMKVGTSPPANPTDGTEVYTGRDQHARVKNLHPKTTYSFAAFARDTEGLVAAPATLTMPGVTVTMKPSPPIRQFGVPLTVFATVTNALTGQGVPSATVQAMAYNSRTGAVIPGPTGITGYDGRTAFQVRPPENYDWFLLVRGSNQTLGGSSTRTTIHIVSLLTIKASTSKLRAGKVLTIVGTAKPITTGELRLQEYVKNKWKTLVKTKPNGAGSATFKIKPAKGKHLYRVHRANSPAVDGGPSTTKTVRAT